MFCPKACGPKNVRQAIINYQDLETITDWCNLGFKSENINKSISSSSGISIISVLSLKWEKPDEDKVGQCTVVPSSSKWSASKTTILVCQIYLAIGSQRGTPTHHEIRWLTGQHQMQLVWQQVAARVRQEHVQLWSASAHEQEPYHIRGERHTVTVKPAHLTLHPKSFWCAAQIFTKFSPDLDVGNIYYW